MRQQLFLVSIKTIKVGPQWGSYVTMQWTLLFYKCHVKSSDVITPGKCYSGACGDLWSPLLLILQFHIASDGILFMADHIALFNELTVCVQSPKNIAWSLHLRLANYGKLQLVILLAVFEWRLNCSFSLVLLWKLSVVHGKYRGLRISASAVSFGQINKERKSNVREK